MEIHRTLVLVTRKLSTNSIWNEHQEISENTLYRENYEIENFQFLNRMPVRKNVRYEKDHIDYFKESGYNTLEEFDRKVTSADLRKESIKTAERDSEVSLADFGLKSISIKEPISSEVQTFLRKIFWHGENAYSHNDHQRRTSAKMIVDTLKTSHLEPVTRDNGIHILREFDRSSLPCQEMIDNLTEGLGSISALIRNKSSDGLKLLDDVQFLLHALAIILKKFSEKNMISIDEFSRDESEAIGYEQSYHTSLHKKHQQCLVGKWKKRLEDLEKLHSAQVLLMMAKCVTLLDSMSE